MLQAAERGNGGVQCRKVMLRSAERGYGGWLMSFVRCIKCRWMTVFLQLSSSDLQKVQVAGAYLEFSS